jgi:4-hydroxy-tetrahydrodipicolinate synthase
MTFEGVYVPTVMPLTADHELDLATYARVIEFQLEAGVAGIVANGTTGEYYALSHDERVQAMTVVRDVAKGKAQLIAGCNAGSTREAARYASTARDLGYEAIMLAAPPTSLPSQRELAAHVVAVTEAGGLPTVLYNYPARAGVEFGLESLDLLADRTDIVAIKESSGDFSRFLQLRSRYDGRIQVICGSDDQAADYFFWGVRAWLAGTANVLPAEHVAVLAAANKGDHEGARDGFATILPFVQDMESGSYNQKAKLGLKHRGYDCGPVRAPLHSLDEDTAAQTLAALAAALGS